MGLLSNKKSMALAFTLFLAGAGFAAANVSTDKVGSLVSDGSIEISTTVNNQTCTCEVIEHKASQNQTNASNLSLPTCGDDCFELVFLIDGRQASGGSNAMTPGQVFQLVAEWIYRVTMKIIQSSGKSDKNFLVVIQYANIRKISLATQLDIAFAELSNKITSISQLDPNSPVDTDESPRLLQEGIESLIKFFNNSTDHDLEGDADSLKLWEDYREETSNATCKSILFTFTHDYIAVGENGIPQDQLDQIKTYFDRTDVVTVLYRNYNEGEGAKSVNLLQSPNGITYEYDDYVSMVSGVDEVARHVCDPYPNVKYTCDVELVFLADASHCACNDVNKIYTNIRKFINEVADSYRTDNELLLGKGLGLGFHAFYRNGNSSNLTFDELFAVDYYKTHSMKTTSLDKFREAVFKFDNSQAPFSDLAVPLSEKVDIPLHDILKDAEKFFTNSVDNENTGTRILIVLKGEDSKDEISLDDALKSQVVALQQHHEHKINIVALPIKENANSVDNSVAHMLNAVLDMPTADNMSSALSNKYDYSKSITATFETLLSKISTCADNNLPEKIVVEKEVDEYVCTCPISIDLKGEGGCIMGARGEEGATGKTGEDGPQGIPGINGPDGPDGSPGDAGPTGLKGEEGETGLTGDPGFHGVPGMGGNQGETGPSGEKGELGTTSNYEWGDIFTKVDINCQCNHRCAERETDWIGGMVTEGEWQAIYTSVKSIEGSDKFMSAEDREMMRDMFGVREDV